MADKKYCAEHEITYTAECFYCALQPTNAALAEESRARIREQEYTANELTAALASARLKYDLLFTATKTRIAEVEKERDTALAELERERAQRKWVSVEERLPGHPNVIALTDSGAVEALYQNGRWFDAYACDGPACYGGIGTVTHWMPLPAPPSAQGGGE